MAHSVVMISRHPYATLMQGGRCLAPTDEVVLHFVTHAHGGADGLDPKLFPHVTVCDSQAHEEVRSVCTWLVRECGAERIVAVHEKVMLVAAELRTDLGLAGLDYETTWRFRDKVTMKNAVADAGAARVPEFAPLETLDDLLLFDWSRGRKVVKSRFGAGAQDVHVVDTLDQARDLAVRLDLPGGEYEVEEFVDGPMYHCDAIVQDGTVRFAAVCEYLSKPGAYIPGGIGGSVLLPPGDPLGARVLELNERALKALGLHEGVTHLEVFHTPDDELVFCEVAARPAGGGIDRIIERSYGVNILEACLRIQSGLDLSSIPGAPTDPDCWAVLGFYPDGSTADGIPAERFAELGIAEHVRAGRAGDGAGGVRHCTDYQDKYVLRGADRDELELRVAEIRRAYAALR